MAILIIIISVTGIITNSVFGQNNERELLDEYCKNNWRESPDMCADYIPEGYFDQKIPPSSKEQLSESDELRIEGQSQNPELKCPSGTYYGLDNQGNPACRDQRTNQIVDPQTGLMFDSQTGEVILNEEQTGYIVVGIFIFIIIIIAITAASRKSKKDYSQIPRQNFSREVEEQTIKNQHYRCNECGTQIGVVKGRMVMYDYDHKDGNHGNNDPNNCQVLCKNCHAIKTEKERGMHDYN